MNQTPLQRIGGRKFVATILSLLSAHSLVWFGKIEPGVYSAVVIATVAAYIAGNVTQKATAKPQVQP